MQRKLIITTAVSLGILFGSASVSLAQTSGQFHFQVRDGTNDESRQMYTSRQKCKNDNRYSANECAAFAKQKVCGVWLYTKRKNRRAAFDYLKRGNNRTIKIIRSGSTGTFCTIR